MTDREFTAWASKRGVPQNAIEAILLFAAKQEEMREAYDAMTPAPPVYTLADIVEMTDADPYGISPRENGFVLIGGCPNGDPIAIDVTGDPGTVWYICHETMHGRPLREVSVRVAADLSGLFEGMAKGNFPFDYFDAKDLADRAGSEMQRESSDPDLPSNAVQRHLAWSGISALVVAALSLVLLRGLDWRTFILFGVPPCFAAARTGLAATRGERRVAWAFLAAIGVGAIVSKFPQLLPNLKGFDRQLDPEHDRMLTWYTAVYLVFAFGVLPAFLFLRALRKHRAGEPAEFSRFTCYMGLFTAGLLCLGIPGLLMFFGFWSLM